MGPIGPIRPIPNPTERKLETMSELSYPPPPPPPPAVPQFDFAKPFTYVFEDPRWLPKVLVGGLFYMAAIVIVGIFFVAGYVARVARNVIAGAATPLPEWDDLGGIFAEGLRLVAVALVYALPMIVFVAAIVIPAAVVGAFDSDGIAHALGSGIAGCFSCLMVPVSLAIMFFLPGSLLFAAVEQRFGAAFEFGRIWPFIKTNIGNYLLAVVIFLIARFLGGVGVVLLCVGVFFTAFWALLITAHAFAQVYRVATAK